MKYLKPLYVGQITDILNMGDSLLGYDPDTSIVVPVDNKMSFEDLTAEILIKLGVGNIECARDLATDCIEDVKALPDAEFCVGETLLILGQE